MITNKGIKYIQQVRVDGNREPWILFMLKGTEEASKKMLFLIEGIKQRMTDYKNRM